MCTSAPRWQRWLDILVALACAQADLDIIPSSSAEAIAEAAQVDRLDLAFLADETRRTSHSTLGLIRALQQVLPEVVEVVTGVVGGQRRT